MSGGQPAVAVERLSDRIKRRALAAYVVLLVIFLVARIVAISTAARM